MTWTELNTITNDILPDAMGPAWDEMLEEGFEDEPLFNCIALDGIIETMEIVTEDADCPEDYSAIIPQLKAVR